MKAHALSGIIDRLPPRAELEVNTVGNLSVTMNGVYVAWIDMKDGKIHRLEEEKAAKEEELTTVGLNAGLMSQPEEEKPVTEPKLDGRTRPRSSWAIRMRVDKMNKISNRDHDTLLGYFDVPVVPLVGELLNINGEPYFVLERGWAIDNNDPSHLFSYIRVR